MFWYLRQHLSRTKNFKAKSWQFIGKYCSFALQQKLISTQTASGVVKLSKTREHRKRLLELQPHSHSSDPTKAPWSGNTSRAAGTLHLLPVGAMERGFTLSVLTALPTATAVPREPGLRAGSARCSGLSLAVARSGRAGAFRGSTAARLANIRQVWLFHRGCI